MTPAWLRQERNPSQLPDTNEKRDSMTTIKVKELANLVLKAYIHFGVNDSRINRRWLVDHDLYGCERAVAQSFQAFNGESIVSLDQIRQRGREIACENHGPLYEAWCAIVEIMENDWVYEDNPFKPATGIASTLIFEEYLKLREKLGVWRKSSAKEFKAFTANMQDEYVDSVSMLLILNRAKETTNDEGIINALSVINACHFALQSCLPATVEALPAAIETESESEPMETVEEAKKPKRVLRDFWERFREIYDENDVQLVGEYMGTNYPITFKCKHCGKEWTRRANTALAKPLGCPRCFAKTAAENLDMDVHHYCRGSLDFRREYLKAIIDRYADGKYVFAWDDVDKYDQDVEFKDSEGSVIKMTPSLMIKALKNSSKHVIEEYIIGGESTMEKNEQAQTIGMFDLLKYYNKAYEKALGVKLSSGWKSMTLAMREVMPEPYAYEKVSLGGRHIDLPVPFDDIEWIACYYEDVAKTPTTDKNALDRAIRFSKVWTEICKELKADIAVKQETAEPQTKEEAGQEIADNHIITIEEQEKVKRLQKLQALQQKNLRNNMEKALQEINHPGFTGTIESIISMLKVAKTMRTLPDEVIAFIASTIGVEIGSADADKLKDELEKLKATNAELCDTIAKLNEQLDEANEWKENVKGLLASA